METNKIALITGASSAIGHSTALRLARQNYDLILAGKNYQTLRGLRNDIESKYRIDVRIVVIDFNELKRAELIIGTLGNKWSQIDLMINIAGIAGGVNTSSVMDPNDWENMVAVSLKGLYYVTRIISRVMQLNKRGHIINVGTINGPQIYQREKISASTGYSIERITATLRRELLRHHVKVTSITPGHIDDYIDVKFVRNEMGSANGPSSKLLSADNIAELITFVASQPDHLNISNLQVTPTTISNAFYLYAN